MPRTVAVSGGFDPLHIGHIRLFKEARALGDYLIVILNNDYWMQKEKGFVFQTQNERKEMIESIRYVNEVIISKHRKGRKDYSVSEELLELQPNIFANGGDRIASELPEYKICEEKKIKMKFNVGGSVHPRAKELLVRIRDDDQVV